MLLLRVLIGAFVLGRMPHSLPISSACAVDFDSLILVHLMENHRVLWDQQ